MPLFFFGEKSFIYTPFILSIKNSAPGDKHGLDPYNFFVISYTTRGYWNILASEKLVKFDDRFYISGLWVR